MRSLVLAALITVAACQSATQPQFTGTCRSWQTTSQQIASNKATVLVFDTPGCSFAKGDHLVLPVGTWNVQSQVAWAPNAQGSRGACLWVNGIVYNESGANAMQGSVGTIVSVSATVISDGTAKVEITGTHTSGVTLGTMVGHVPTNILTFVSATRVK